jgi:hypothetical protein
MLKDGNITVYLLQIKLNPKVWSTISFDYFGYPSIKGYDAKEGFSASGDCWQQTQIQGTFNIKYGLASLRMMSEKYTSYTWRLVEQTISSKTTEIARTRFNYLHTT